MFLRRALLPSLAMVSACRSGSPSEGASVSPAVRPPVVGSDASAAAADDTASGADAGAVSSKARHIVISVGDRLLELDAPAGVVHEWGDDAFVSDVYVRARRPGKSVREDLDYFLGKHIPLQEWVGRDFEEQPGGLLVARDPLEHYHDSKLTVSVREDLDILCAELTFDRAPQWCQTLVAHTAAYTPLPPGDPTGMREIVDDHPAFEIRYRRKDATTRVADYWVERGGVYSVDVIWTQEWHGQVARRSSSSCDEETMRGSVTLTDAWGECADVGHAGVPLSLELVVARRTMTCPALRCMNIYCRAHWHMEDPGALPTDDQLRYARSRLRGICGDLRVVWK